MFIAILAVSQEDDDCRTWPCEGEITLRLLRRRPCDPFVTKFSIRKSIMIQQDDKLAMSEIRDWVPLPEEAIPFGQYSSPPYVRIPYISGDIPSTELKIRIEIVVLNEESQVWKCS